MDRKLSENQRKAAAWLAQGGRTESEIAAELGVTEVTLWRWKRLPAFREQVEVELAGILERVRAEGIANRQNRVAAAMGRHRLLQQVIEERAAHYAGREAKGEPVAPGAKTGLLASKPIPGKWRTVEEYRVDTGMLREIRELEVQVAKDLGQWVEKSEHSGDGPVIRVTILSGVDEAGADPRSLAATRRGGRALSAG